MDQSSSCQPVVTTGDHEVQKVGNCWTRASPAGGNSEGELVRAGCRLLLGGVFRSEDILSRDMKNCPDKMHSTGGVHSGADGKAAGEGKEGGVGNQGRPQGWGQRIWYKYLGFVQVPRQSLCLISGQ